MTHSRLPLLAAVGVLAVAVAARAGDDLPTAAVRDEARLFSPEARRKADEEIADIKKVYRLDFVLETASAAPEDVKKQLLVAKTNAQKTQILHAWGARRAEAAGSDGVYVLVCKDVVHGWFGREYGCVVVVVAPKPSGGPSPPWTPRRSTTVSSGSPGARTRRKTIRSCGTPWSRSAKTWPTTCGHPSRGCRWAASS